MPQVNSGPKVDSAQGNIDALPTLVAGTVFSTSLRPLPSTATQVCVRLCKSMPITTAARHFLVRPQVRRGRRSATWRRKGCV
jgi:hypothetical protein